MDVQETYVYQLTHEAKAAEVTVESTDSAKLGSNVDETV